MKTSLGIWAFGPMVTRFVPGGYQPQWAGETTAEQGAAGGRGARRPDRRLRVPLPAGALADDNLDEVREALGGPRHLLHRERDCTSTRCFGRGGLSVARRRRARRRRSRRTLDGRRLRGRARRALHHLAGDRGLQLPVPDAVRGELGAARRRDRPGGAALQGARRHDLPRAQELRAGDEDPHAEHRHDAARDPHAAAPGPRQRQGQHGLAAPDHERREPRASTRRCSPPRGCSATSTRTRAGGPSTTTTWSARPPSWRRSSSRVELRRAGYGDERRAARVRPLPLHGGRRSRRSEAVGAAVAVHRLGGAPRIDERRCAQAQQEKDAVRAYELVYAALGAE